MVYILHWLNELLLLWAGHWGIGALKNRHQLFFWIKTFNNKQDRFTTCLKIYGTSPLEFQNCRREGTATHNILKIKFIWKINLLDKIKTPLIKIHEKSLSGHLLPIKHILNIFATYFQIWNGRLQRTCWKSNSSNGHKKSIDLAWIPSEAKVGRTFYARYECEG